MVWPVAGLGSAADGVCCSTIQPRPHFLPLAPPFYLGGVDANDLRPEQAGAVIDGTAPILDYLAKLVRDVRHGRTSSAPPAVPHRGGVIDVYLSPNGGATDAIVREVGRSKERLRVQAYSFTSAPIARRTKWQQMGEFLSQDHPGR